MSAYGRVELTPAEKLKLKKEHAALRRAEELKKHLTDSQKMNLKIKKQQEMTSVFDKNLEETDRNYMDVTQNSELELSYSKS